MAAFRTPAVNYITRYTQMNRQQMPDEERQMLAQASRETLDNSSTGFVVGGAIPFGLLRFAKYRAGLGVIRMCAGLFGATIGSYLAAKYTTDKFYLCSCQRAVTANYQKRFAICYSRWPRGVICTNIPRKC